MTKLIDLFESKRAPEGAKLGRIKGSKAEEPELKKYDVAEGRLTPQVPKDVHRSFRRYPWGMLGNDQYGDCGPAMILHGDEQAQLTTGAHPTPYTTQYAEEVYGITAGWKADDPSTDVGTYWDQLKDYMVNTGIGGTKIAGAANVDTSNISLVDRAIWEFDCLYTGVWLPNTAQTQTIWDVDTTGSQADQAPGSWGGHWIPIFSYDGVHFAFVSWGQIMLMTQAFFEAYCTPAVGGEGHVVVTPHQIKSVGVTSAGFNLSQLVADLGAI